MMMIMQRLANCAPARLARLLMREDGESLQGSEVAGPDERRTCLGHWIDGMKKRRSLKITK